MQSNTPHPHHEQPAAAAAAVRTLEQADGGRRRRGWARFLDDHSTWLEENQEALMVVAALVAGIALQAGINPPGGILTAKYFDGERYHEPGTSLLAVANPVAYTCFFLTQTAALLGSLTVILLTVSGLPLNPRPRASLWVRRVITWVSITALAIMDSISKGAFTPISRDEMDPVLLMVIYSDRCAIMSLVLLAVFVRVIGRLVICMKMRG